MGQKIKDETGNKYNKLLVLRQGGKTANSTIKWICKCDCGNEAEIVGANLRNGQAKSCGCEMGRKEEFEGSSVYRKMYQTIKVGARRADREFKLLFEEWKQIVDSECHYCGSKGDPHWAWSKKRWSKGIEFDNSATFNGVDRVDSSKGYTKKNSVSCCNTCNRMKSDFDLEFFKTHIEKINSYGKRKLSSVHRKNK